MVEGRTKTPELRDMEYDEREDADLEAEVYKNITSPKVMLSRTEGSSK